MEFTNSFESYLILNTHKWKNKQQECKKKNSEDIFVFNNIVYYFKCNQNNSSYRNYRQLWYCVILSLLCAMECHDEIKQGHRRRFFISSSCVT